MFANVMETSPDIVSASNSTMDEASLVDGRGIARITTGEVSCYPSVVENDEPPLQGIVVDSMNAWSGITRFLNHDGAVEELLHVEGPLPKRGFESKWALRELLRGSGEPLAYRSAAGGDALIIRATNERTALAFELLAQGALDYPFLLAHE